MAVYSAPTDTDRMVLWFNSAENCDSRGIRISAVSPPLRSGQVFKSRRRESLGQGRLNLSRMGPRRFCRVRGIVVHLRKEKPSLNTATPAAAQILLHACWFVEETGLYRSIFVGAAAFDASYAPRDVGQACNLTLGVIATGALGKPYPGRNCTDLASWNSGPPDG